MALHTWRQVPTTTLFVTLLLRLFGAASGVRGFPRGRQQLQQQPDQAEEGQQGLVQMWEAETTPAPEEVVYNVLVVGKTGTGKSTLCQWLLNDGSVCAIGAGLQSKTQTIEVAEGHWWGDTSKGQLRVMDTPGFLGTDENDAADWLGTVATIKSEMPRLDAVILTIEDTISSAIFNADIINKIRLTFGTDLWKNIVVFSKTWSGFKPGAGHWGQSQQDFETLEHRWNSTFFQVEFQESKSNWDNAPKARDLLKEDIEAIPYEGACLRDDIFPQGPIDITGYPIDGNPTPQGYGFDKMQAMRSWILDKRSASGEAWDLENLVARFGPSFVASGQDFMCGWPHDCMLNVTGSYLSDQDQLRIFPEGHTCGDDFTDTGISWPFNYYAQRARLGATSDEWRMFALGDTKLIGKDAVKFKMCYCEYGNCDLPARFFQEVGLLTIDPTKCEVPCPANDASFTVEDETTYCGGEVVEVLYQETVRFDCITGYAMEGNKNDKNFTRTCKNIGELTVEQYCAPVICDPIPAFLQADRADYLVDEHFVYTNQANYRCSDTYTLNGDPTGLVDFRLRCGDMADWDFTGEPAYVTLADFLQFGCRRWTTSQWSRCDVGCGEGNRTRTTACDPEGALCDPASEPHTTETCFNYTDCPDCGHAPNISYSARTVDPNGDAPLIITDRDPVNYACEVADGYTLTGHRDNNETYTGLDGPSTSIVLYQVYCVAKYPLPGADAREAILEIKDEATQTDLPLDDFLAKGCRRWQPTEWSLCSVDCGPGTKTRDIVCSTGINADCDENAAKLTTVNDCIKYTGCPDCGPAPVFPHAERTVDAEGDAPNIITGGVGVDYACDVTDRYTLTAQDDNSADMVKFRVYCKALLPTAGATKREALREIRSFDGQSVLPLDALLDKGCRRWAVNEWSRCSVSCGPGTKMRETVCSTGIDADCAAEFKKPYNANGVIVSLSDSCTNYTDCPDCSAAPVIPHAQRVFDSSAAAPLLITDGDAVAYACDSNDGYTITADHGDASALVKFSVSCKAMYPTQGAAAMVAKKEVRDHSGVEVLSLDLLTTGCRRWELEEWSRCSVGCGPGTRTRDTECSTGIDTDCTNESKLIDALNAPYLLNESCTNYTNCPNCGSAPVIPNAKRLYDSEAEAPLLVTDVGKVEYTCDYQNGYSLNAQQSDDTDFLLFSVSCKALYPSAGATLREAITEIRNNSNEVVSLELLTKGCRRWQTTDWSDCSQDCGDGNRTRETLCSTGIEQDCDADVKPFDENGDIVILSKDCTSYEACPDCNEAPEFPHATRMYDSWKPAPTLVTGGEAVRYSCDVYYGYTLTAEHSDSPNNTQFELSCAAMPHTSGAISNEAVRVLRNNAGELMNVDEFLAKGCRSWSFTDWGVCDASCGPGKQTRSTVCSTGDKNDCSEADEGLDKTGQPVQLIGDCEGHITCPSCGVAPVFPHASRMFDPSSAAPNVMTGGASIMYKCDVQDQFTLTGASGDSARITEFQVLCNLEQNTDDATEYTPVLAVKDWANNDALSMDEMLAKGCRKWDTTPWGTCSVNCGQGIKFRGFTCTSGNVSDCNEADRPDKVLGGDSISLQETCVGTECDLDASGNYNKAGAAAVNVRQAWLVAIAATVVLAWLSAE